MQQIFIGVDGGGSRVRVCAQNEAGDALFCKEGGPANIRTSTHTAWESILTALKEGFTEIGKVFPEKNVDYHASLGLAGVEYAPALELFLDYPHPFSELVITSDARIACLGAHGMEPGAIIIVGTGIIGYQQEEDTITRVGGWGFPHDDEGSGAHLGMQAVRALFKAFDGRDPHSYLTNEMLKKWPTPDILLAHMHQADAKTFASIVPLVFIAAKAHDPLALSLIERTCDAIYSISAVLEKATLSKDATLPLVLMGGLATSLLPFLQPEFKEKLRDPVMSPEQGALLLIR